MKNQSKKINKKLIIQPKKENICAIFVTYNPDESLIKNIEAIINQVKKIVIIDNKSASDSWKFIKKITKKHSNINLIKNNGNVGLAKALNQGAEYALKNKYEWILTMDQDSLARYNMVKFLIKAYNNAVGSKTNPVLIGSNFLHEYNKKSNFERLCKNKVYIKRNGIQTSGSLLSLSTYKNIGPFRNDFFIDYIDTEYCLRLKHKKLNTIIACDAYMLHSIAAIEKGASLPSYNHLRRYYRMKNGLKLVKENIFKDPLWTIKKIFYFNRELAIIFFTEKNKIKKLKSIFKGILHSFKKNTH